MISKNQVKKIIDNEYEGPTLDYKEDLTLQTNGDKAEFIKDVVSLANSSKVAHIIIGVQDKPKKLVGLNTSHTTEQLNDILKNKCDPPLSLEYVEQDIFGHQVGVIEIHGENPPYIISVQDKYGGKRSHGESCIICRGTIFIRNNNKNEGAIRENIEKMYENKIKHVMVQADLQLTHSLIITKKGEFKEVTIDFTLTSIGEVLVGPPFMYVEFKNINRIINCKKWWSDCSDINPVPTAQCYSGLPVAGSIDIGGVTVQVDKNLKRINTEIGLHSTNMKNKRFKYLIPLG